MTFNYNPDNMFYYPVQTTVLTKMCLGVKLNVPVQLAFSIRPPSPQNTSGVVFPFPKDFQDAQEEEEVVEDRFGGIPPDDFLHDVDNHPALVRGRVGRRRPRLCPGPLFKKEKQS